MSKSYHVLVDEGKAQALRNRYEAINKRGILMAVFKETEYSYSHVHLLLKGKIRMTVGAYSVLEKALDKVEKSLTPPQTTI